MPLLKDRDVLCWQMGIGILDMDFILYNSLYFRFYEWQRLKGKEKKAFYIYSQNGCSTETRELLDNVCYYVAKVYLIPLYIFYTGACWHGN